MSVIGSLTQPLGSWKGIADIDQSPRGKVKYLRMGCNVFHHSNQEHLKLLKGEWLVQNCLLRSWI